MPRASSRGHDSTVGRGEGDGDGVVAHLIARDRDVQALPLLLGERHGAIEIVRGDADAVSGRDLEAVVAGGARDVVDLDQETRIVAVVEELRDAGRNHHRIADQHVLDGVADAIARPRHRHHPHGAVELRHVERDGGLAFGIDLDDARIEGDELLGRWRRGQTHAAAVAAGPDLAGHAQHTVDEQAVEVADIHAELALAEVPVVRSRRLEIGEVEDADIDGGNRDIGPGARLEIADRDRNRHRLARAHLVDDAERDGEVMVARIDLGPGQAEGARGHALGRDVHRAEQGRRDVGAGSPLVGDLEVDASAFLRHFDRLRGDQPVVEHRDHRDAGEARIEAELGRVADVVGRLVEGDVEDVRGLRRGRGDVPSGVELVARGGRLVAEAFDRQAIAAPVDIGRDHHRPLGRGVDLAGGDALGAGHDLVVPTAVGAVPLVLRRDPVEPPGEAGPGNALAVRIDEDDVEIGGGALLDLVVAELRPDADHRHVRRHRQRQPALDGAAVGVGDADDDLGLERHRGRRQFGQRDVDGRLAVLVGGGAEVDRLAHRLDLIVGEAETVAAEAGAGVGGADVDVAVDRQAGRGGAVEIAGVDVDRDRLGRADRLGVGLELEGEALGLEVLDQHRGLGDGASLGVGIEADLPRAAHGVGEQLDIRRIAAEAGIGQRLAEELDAVRPLDHEGEGQAGDGDGARVADQRGEMDGLARPVDSALGRHEHIERPGRGAAVDAAVGQIERGAGEVDERIVAIADAGVDHLRGGAAGAAGEAGIEADIAVLVGGALAEHVVIDRDEAELDAGDRLGGRQRADDGVDAVAAGERGQAEVGDHEPLCGELAPLVGIELGLGGDDVDTPGGRSGIASLTGTAVVMVLFSSDRITISPSQTFSPLESAMFSALHDDRARMNWLLRTA